MQKNTSRVALTAELRAIDRTTSTDDLLTLSVRAVGRQNMTDGLLTLSMRAVGRPNMTDDLLTLSMRAGDRPISTEDLLAPSMSVESVTRSYSQIVILWQIVIHSLRHHFRVGIHPVPTMRAGRSLLFEFISVSVPFRMGRKEEDGSSEALLLHTNVFHEPLLCVSTV